MGVRPNIQSPLKLDGTKLKVRGESDEPLPKAIHVVVVQPGPPGSGQVVDVARGTPDRISTGWHAELKATGFKTGPAEALGVEIRVAPFQVTSWSQSVTIE